MPVASNRNGMEVAVLSSGCLVRRLVIPAIALAVAGWTGLRHTGMFYRLLEAVGMMYLIWMGVYAAVVKPDPHAGPVVRQTAACGRH